MKTNAVICFLTNKKRIYATGCRSSMGHPRAQMAGATRGQPRQRQANPGEAWPGKPRHAASAARAVTGEFVAPWAAILAPGGFSADHIN